jgi:sugar phosphate isomerase/epimerase
MAYFAFAKALAPQLPEPSPISLCLEHTNSLRHDVSFVHTLRDAIDLAERLDIHVCMEINACWAERDLARTIAAGIGRIGIVQVSDFSIGTLSTPNRLVPGDGDIPLRRVIGHVLDAGYAGVFDLELVGPAIEAEGYRSALARSCEYVSELLSEVD